MDIDSDGYQDMVMASYEGIARISMGTKNGFRKPKFIRDADDQLVSGPIFWSETHNAFKSSNRVPTGATHPRLDITTNVATVDWDADGDQDLVMAGHENGVIYLCRNNGTSKKPEFSTTNQLVQSGDKPLTIPGEGSKNGIAGFRIVDWDADGKFDLICSGIRGGVFLFRNVGTSGSPKFSNAKTLIPRIETDAFEEFLGRTLAPMKDNRPTMPTTGFHVEVIDYDRDGDLDILVGGSSMWFAKKVEPIKDSDRKLFAEYKVLEKKLNSVPKDQAIAIEEEYLKLHDKLESLVAKDSEHMRIANHIWLYRRK